MLEVVTPQRQNTCRGIVRQFSMRSPRDDVMVFFKNQKNVSPTEAIHQGQSCARNDGPNQICAETDGEGNSLLVSRQVLFGDFVIGTHVESLQLLQRIHHIMITDPAQITRHHLANQVAPDFSLIRKVCACGKASTAKQLVQQGKCAACAMAAVRDAIMPGDFAKLQHMLGAVKHYPKSKWGWRNYFAAGSGQQHEAMQRLVAAGLAIAGRACGDMTYFYATRLGCKAAGLDGTGIKRAMEDAP